MQMTPSFIIRICAFFVLGIFLGGALLTIPVTPFGHRTLSYLMIGLVPLPFFSRDLKLRYLTFWITLAGAAGVLHMLTNYLRPFFGDSSYVNYGSHTTLIVGIFYILFGGIGLLMLRYVKSPSRTSAKSLRDWFSQTGWVAKT